MGAYRFERLKVLVVDDNPHMRTLITTVLQAFGIVNVYEAAGSEEAWELLNLHPCDVIVLDWVLKGTSGLAFAERIRTAPDSPNPFTPIIMLTGHTSVEHVQSARDGGVNEFLAKPVSAKAIMSRLLSVIEHPRPFVRTKSYFGPCRRRRRDMAYHGPERRASGSDFTDVDMPEETPAA